MHTTAGYCMSLQTLDTFYRILSTATNVSVNFLQNLLKMKRGLDKG